MTYAKDMYTHITDFLSWIDPSILKEMIQEDLDHVQQVISENESIIKS